MVAFDRIKLLSCLKNTYFALCETNRSSLSQMLFKVDVLKNFINFTGKHQCSNLFLINFIKKRLQHKCFLAKYADFLRTPFFYRTPSVTGSEQTQEISVVHLAKGFLAIQHKSTLVVQCHVTPVD